MTELVLDGLSLAYGRLRVLDDVTVAAVTPGTLVGVLGPNGAGKSTLLRALAGLGPYGGEARLDGESLAAMPHHRRAGRIGYLPQALPQGTSLVAYEAVVSACRAVRPDLGAAAVESLAEDIFGLLGIRHLAFRALNAMSGGQRQMVGLAQVIVRRPAVLLLDEPTSALDLRWQLNVFAVVRRVLDERGGICLMALHDINLALRHSDAILLLGGGGVISYGPPARAMTRERLRDAYRVEGRVEFCSAGRPFVVTDGVIDQQTDQASREGRP